MSTTSSLHTEIDKLQWEVQKLKAETEELHRPFWNRVNFWTSALTVVLAVAGVLLQYSFSSLEYRKAEILRDEAEFDTKKAQAQLASIEKDVKEKQSQLDELTRITKELEALRIARERELNTVSLLVRNLKEENALDRKTQFLQIESSLKTLNVQQSQSAVLTNLLGGLNKK